MSTRTDYTADEWESVRQAPAQAVIAVEQASPSGFRGRRRERKAEEKGFGAYVAQFADLGLIAALVAAKDEEGRLVDALRSGGEPFVDTAVETARKARRAIEAKGTREELEAYVNAILETAESVALASTERGESNPTSAAEALLLRRLADALGRQDYQPPDPRWTKFDPSYKEE
jgi:hypothetical protein